MKYSVLTLLALTFSFAVQAADSGVLAEIWQGIKGERVADLTKSGKYKKTPQAVRVLKSFSVSSVGDECGVRYSALLTPPKTGSYTFWIAADDSAELWLSTDEQAKGAKKIAHVDRYVGEEEWTKLPSQASKPVELKQGKSYYIMALHKDLGGADHLAVAWQGPGLKRRVISGEHVALPSMGRGTRALLAKAQALERAFAEFTELSPERLEGFVAGLNAADHKGLAEKLGQKLTAAKKGRNPELLKKVAELGEGLKPSPEKPVLDAVLKAVLGFEDAYLKTLTIDQLEVLGPHRTCGVFGLFNRGTAYLTKTVAISSRGDKEAGEWVSTGLYAIPGKRITVTISAEWADKELTLRIGHHNPGGKGAFDCMPDTRRHAALSAAATDAISPYGGLLFIDVPKEVGMANVPITFEGIVEAPRFILGETTDETWQSVRQAPGPWGELVADRIVIVVHSEALRELDNPTELMAWWNDAVTRHEDFYNHDRGTPFRMHVMHNARMGVSYWPLEWRKASVPGILDARKLSAYSDGLFLHEHGHHADNGAMIFGNIGESTPNWAGYYMKGTGADFAWKDTEETHMLALFDTGNSHHQEVTEDGWWTRKYTHHWSYPCTSMMVGYAQGFGWESFKTVVHRFTEGADPVNEMAIFQSDVLKKPWYKRTAEDNKVLNKMKIDKWLIFLSEEAKHDVRPYFAHFALRPSEAAAKALDKMALPKWDLVYIPERPVIVSKGQTVVIPSPTDTALTFSGDLEIQWTGNPNRGEMDVREDGTLTYRASRWRAGRETIPYTLTNPLGNRFEGELEIHVVSDRENPHFAAGELSDVPLDTWTAIRFPRSYRRPVVLANAISAAEKDKPNLVVRTRKVAGKGFEAKIVAPEGSGDERAFRLVWAAMEAGTYRPAEHGLDGIAATTEAIPEGLSNQMSGIENSYADDRAKLRASCFGQVMSANDPNWSSFYWSADRSICGLRIGGHYDLEAAPRQAETIGYMLLSRGLYQCGDILVKVDRSLTIGDHVLAPGQADLKGLLRARRHAMRFRDRYGKESIIVGGWATADGTLKTEFVPVEWATTGAFRGSGAYEIILASDDRARNGLYIQSVDVLKDGVRVTGETHDGVTTKTSSKDNIYRVQLEDADPRAEYTIRATVRVDQVNGVYGSVMVRPVKDDV